MNTELKQIDNNKEEKPFEFYLEKYQKLDPKEVSTRCNIQYDEESYNIKNYDYHHLELDEEGNVVTRNY